MLLIPDTYRLSVFNFKDKLHEILNRIREISEAEGNQPIYVIVSNKRNFTTIRDSLKDLHNLTVDYYRSARSIGVARDERVCITVGLAETPGNSCDPLTRTYEESRCLRKQGVQAASWQAINRVRDPEGLVESRVYFIGSRLDEIKQTSTWGTDRRIVVTGESTWTAPDGVIHPKYTYEVTTSTEITPVHIQADAKVNDKRHPERLKVTDYIDSIIINAEKVSKASILNDRGNGDVLDINNNTPNKNQAGNQVAQTVAGISWLVGRADIYGEQQPDGGYRKVLRHLDTDVLEAHVAGNITVGSYQIREDDTVRWAAIDIDCHKGNDANRAEDERAKAEWILNKYKIPFILEASGSPHSYHIWTILSPTKTYNAYRFIRQITSEADIDCEVFPKQKSNDKTKYGNLIKLPYGKNLKNSNWSSYIDPDTDERIPCPATPPGIVRLLEVPKDVKVNSKTVGRYRAGSPRITADSVNSELDYCMTEALKGVALTGSAGHNLRVAIATKAVALGWTEDRICNLFREQPDFREELTRVKIREIAGRGYHPYSCETLRDQCGSLVGVYCAGCRFKPKDILS